MRTLLILFFSFHAGISFSQAAAAGQSTLVEAGIPALSREWSGEDYVQASKVLAQGKLPLPRMTDEEGRLFIQRLTDTGNFSFLRNEALPLAKRMPHYFNLLAGATAISGQYLTAAEKGLAVHREFSQQLAFSIRISALGVELMNEFMLSIPKDKNYEARKAGMQRAYAGLMKMFSGTADSLSDSKFFTPADHTLLLTTMAETLPAMKKVFPADYKAELRKKLESHRPAFPDGEGAKAIQQMIDELGA